MSRPRSDGLADRAVLLRQSTLTKPSSSKQLEAEFLELSVVEDVDVRELQASLWHVRFSRCEAVSLVQPRTMQPGSGNRTQCIVNGGADTGLRLCMSAGLLVRWARLGTPRQDNAGLALL